MNKTGVDSQKLAPGVVLDFDRDGRIVGIDIDNASKVADLSRIQAEPIPIAGLSITNS